MSEKVSSSALYARFRGYSKGSEERILSKQEEYAHIHAYLADKNIISRDALLVTCIPYITKFVGKNGKRLLYMGYEFGDIIHSCILHTLKTLEYLHKFDFKSRLISFISPALARHLWSLSNPVNLKYKGTLVTNQDDSVFETYTYNQTEQEAIRLEELEHMEQAYNSMSLLNQGRVRRIVNGETRRAVAISEGRHHHSIIHSLKQVPQIL